MAKATRDGHPDHDFSAVTRRGLKAAALEPRLPVGMLDGLTTDLQKLGVDVPGALVSRSSALTARRCQDEAPARGDLLVTAIRTSVLRRGAACGVGARGRARLRRAIGNLRAAYSRKLWNRGAA